MGGQRYGGQGPVQPEQSLEAAVGETVDLTVEDLPGAGYRWVLRSLPAGISVLDEDADPAPRPQSSSVGGVARRTVRLRAEAVGQHLVELAFVRPWEQPDVAPARLRQVLVIVSAS